MSTEYALLRGGEIFTVVTTSKPLWEVALAHGDYEVKPLDQVPERIKVKYQYWDERP